MPNANKHQVIREGGIFVGLGASGVIQGAKHTPPLQNTITGITGLLLGS